MKLLKSTGFLLKSLYLRPFHHLNIRGDFRIFSNLLVSSCAFSQSFGKNIGKRGIFTNEILAQKMHTVKSTLAEKEFSFPLPTARLWLKNETPKVKIFHLIKKKSSGKSEDRRHPPWHPAIHFEFPVSVTDETPKITEQAKIHILPLFFAMMGSFKGKRRNLHACN